MIPDYMHFDGTSLPPQWTDGADQNQSIYRGTQIRMRIRGMRPEGATMQAIATINEDFLG
jgi:DNA-directed RNA polymerase II subunit RPB7